MTTQAVAGLSYALLALLGMRVAGLASYERTGAPGMAEVAFAVRRRYARAGDRHLAARAPGVGRPGPAGAGLRRVDPGLVHKSDAGAVELGIHGHAEAGRALGRLRGRFGDRLSGVLVQAMIPGGTETIIGVVQEPVFGPVVVFGLGGVATEAPGDHAARLAPLTGTDADDLIHDIRAAPLLLGHRGEPAADIGALRDALLRVSRLADDLPQVAELDLNPVIARPDGVFAVDARMRVTSHRAADPFLRQLRLPPAATSRTPRRAGSEFP